MMKHNARLYTFYTISIVFVFMILFVYVNRKGNSDLIMNLRKNRMLEENENLEKKHEKDKDKEQWKTQDIALKDGYKLNTSTSNDSNKNLSSSNNFPQPESFNSTNYGKMSYEEKNPVDRNENKSDGKNKDSNDANIDEPQRNINSFMNMMDQLNNDNEELKRYLQQRYVPPDHVRMPQEINSAFEMPENILSQQFYRNQLENQIPTDLVPEGTRSKNPSDKKDDDKENEKQNKPEYNSFKSQNQKENNDKEHQDEKKNLHQDKNTTDEMMNFAGMFDDLSSQSKKNQRTNKSFQNQFNQNALPTSDQFTPINITSQNAFTLDESNKNKKDENNNDKKSDDSSVDLQNINGIHGVENNKKHNKDDKETDRPLNENDKFIPNINNSELSLEKTNKSTSIDNNLFTSSNIDQTQMNPIWNKADNMLENEDDKDNEKNNNQDNPKDRQKSIEDLIHESILDDSSKDGKDKKDKNKEENVPEIQNSNIEKGKSQHSIDVVNYDDLNRNQQHFDSFNSSKKKDKKSDDDHHDRNILPLPNQLNPGNSASKDKTSEKQEIPIDPIISPENPDNEEKQVSHHKPDMIQETIMFSIKSSHGKDKKEKKNDKTKSDLSEFRKGKAKNTSASITIVSKVPLTTEKKHDHKKKNQNGIENNDSLLTDKGIIKPENIPPKKSKKSKHSKNEMTPAEKISANYTESTPIFRDLTEIEPKKSLKEKRNEIQNDSKTKKNIVPVIKFKDLQNEMKNVEDIIDAMNFLRYGKEMKFDNDQDGSSENNNSLDNDSDEENYYEKEISQTSSETRDENDEYENMHKKKSHHQKKYKHKAAHDRSRGKKHKKYKHKKMFVATEPDAAVELK